MSDNTAITAELRERAGKGAARATRREGKVPGVIYGAKQDPICIALDPRILWAEISKAGFTTRLFEVDLGKGGKHRCLARDVAFHPVTDQPIHVDFMRVSSDAAVHVRVPVHCINQERAPGIKRGGVINLEHHDIEVVCSPDSIPKDIQIDVGAMDIGQAVHFSHLVLPPGVRALHMAGDATIVTMAPPTVTKAETAAEGEAAAATPAS